MHGDNSEEDGYLASLTLNDTYISDDGLIVYDIDESGEQHINTFIQNYAGNTAYYGAGLYIARRSNVEFTSGKIMGGYAYTSAATIYNEGRINLGDVMMGQNASNDRVTIYNMGQFIISGNASFASGERIYIETIGEGNMENNTFRYIEVTNENYLNDYKIDFSEVKGQEMAKRAL